MVARLNCALYLHNDRCEIHLLASRPFSISNPEDRVLFSERTIHVPCEGELFIFRVPRVETLGLAQGLDLWRENLHSRLVVGHADSVRRKLAEELTKAIIANL